MLLNKRPSLARQLRSSNGGRKAQRRLGHRSLSVLGAPWHRDSGWSMRAPQIASDARALCQRGKPVLS